MTAISFKRHRFPADVIRQAVWLYFRFTLSFRDVEELLGESGASRSVMRLDKIRTGDCAQPQAPNGTRKSPLAPG
jgi:transposase-like protein